MIHSFLLVQDEAIELVVRGENFLELTGQVPTRLVEQFKSFPTTESHV